MEVVTGEVKHYAWGDTEFIPSLLGVEPDGRPWAELWLGTHAGGPSHLANGTPLSQVSGPLGYLLKVLAAAEPLSLQTHPDLAQAQAGFEAGVFADPHPKPELLCALSRFEALCGLRPADRTIHLLDELEVHALRHVVADAGPAAAVIGLYRGTIDPGPVVAGCANSDRTEAEWVRRLDAMYPGDPSVAATLLLNHVVLEPGQALHLSAGNLHAYLQGAGIELMGASDNVVRGGLTTKPVDIEQLLHVADLTPLDDPVLSGGSQFDLPEAGVGLRLLAAGERHIARGHELSIDLAGVARYAAPGNAWVADAATFVVVPLGA